MAQWLKCRHIERQIEGCWQEISVKVHTPSRMGLLNKSPSCCDPISLLSITPKYNGINRLPTSSALFLHPIRGSCNIMPGNRETGLERPMPSQVLVFVLARGKPQQRSTLSDQAQRFFVYGTFAFSNQRKQYASPG